MDAEVPPPQFNGVPAVTNEREAWDRLVTAVQPGLVSFIRRRMGMELRLHMTAENVWQETLLHAWRDRFSFRWQGAGGFSRWLTRIAENRLRNLADRETAAKRGSGAVAGLADILNGVSGDADTPDSLALHKERDDAVLDMIEGLPENLSAVLRLKFFDGLTMPEIAGRLGIGVSAAKHRLCRALRRCTWRLVAQVREWQADHPPAAGASPKSRDIGAIEGRP